MEKIKSENTQALRGLKQSINRGTIHSADYAPTIYPQFSLENENCGIFLGCELELEANDEVSSGIIRNCIFPKYLRKMSGILKKDGSLGRHGIELLLLPHTFPALLVAGEQAKLPQCFDYLNLLATSYDNSRCGLHIHVDRSGLLEYAHRVNEYSANYCDLQRAIARIFVAFRHQIREISKRKDAQMRFCQLPTDVGGYNNYDKYLACNFKHEKTVEIRIWRGTLNYKSIVKYYALSQALCMFAIKRFEADAPDSLYRVAGENEAKCLFGAALWSDFVEYYGELVFNLHRKALIHCNLDNFLLIGTKK